MCMIFTGEIHTWLHLKLVGSWFKVLNSHFKNIFQLFSFIILPPPNKKASTSLYVCISFSVCLWVPKDLANRWTDRVLLYRVASHRPWEVYNYFGGGYHHPPKRKLIVWIINVHQDIKTEKDKKIFLRGWV